MQLGVQLAHLGPLADAAAVRTATSARSWAEPTTERHAVLISAGVSRIAIHPSAARTMRAGALSCGRHRRDPPRRRRRPPTVARCGAGCWARWKCSTAAVWRSSWVVASLVWSSACCSISRASPVTADAIVDAIWGESPPTSAHGTVQSYVSRLRRALEPRRDHDPPRRGRLRAGSRNGGAGRRTVRGPGRRRSSATPRRRRRGRELLMTADTMWRGPAPRRAA